jgi:hypothetical protein
MTTVNVHTNAVLSGIIGGAVVPIGAVVTEVLSRWRARAPELRGAVLGYVIGRHPRAAGTPVLLRVMLGCLAIAAVLAVIERYWLLLAALLVLWVTQRPTVRDALARVGEPDQALRTIVELLRSHFRSSRGRPRWIPRGNRGAPER